MINNLETISCSICLTDNINRTNTYITNCNHSFCKTCFILWLDNKKYTCPMCRATIKEYKNTNNRRITEINKIIYIHENQIIRGNMAYNLNRNILYQNLRLQSFIIILFILLMFSINFLVIYYENYHDTLVEYEELYNCTKNNCENYSIIMC